ncbi:GCN5-related N-acetyltransferase domain protein, partial [mine drainage metagenome]
MSSGAGGPPSADRSDVVVRRLRSDEVREFRWIRLRSLATDAMAFGSTYAREAAFLAAVWEERARDGATAADRGYWVAVAPDEQFVGLVGAIPQPPELVVVAMWVAPSHRRHGIAGRLLDALLDWADTVRPGGRVHLSVNPAQLAAVRLYESRGFVRTGATEPLPHAPM